MPVDSICPMLIMQYTFRLPADYPMATVRQRVEERRHAFDAYPGLGWKAFLIRERGAAHATDNQYAPLYLWFDPEAAVDFLKGALFAGVTNAFGWTPAVQQLILDHQAGPAAGQQPFWCTQQSVKIGGHADLRALAVNDGRPQHGLHSRWVALDPSRWVATVYELWVERPITPVRRAILYEIAYFATSTAASTKEIA
jgi:hypothetical protein